MHIVHIEDFFHPLAGYKYNIISKYMIKYGHKVTIVAPSLEYRNDILTNFFGKDNIEELDKEFTNKYGVRIVRLNVKKYFRTRAIYDLNELNGVVQSLKPDILSIGIEIVPAYFFLLKYKKLGCPIVLDCHNIKSATTFFAAPLHHLIHRLIFTPIIKKNDIRIIRCVDDNYIEECLNLPLTNSPIVSFGSDLQIFHKNEEIYDDFRKTHNLDNDDIVFAYIGKLDVSKGGDMLAEAFSKKFDTKKRICLIIVGNNNYEQPDVLEKKLDNSENVIFRYPTQKYIDLPKFYQCADAVVFPRQCSLSFFDAQACGLPVIAENISINKDRLSHNNGLLFESNSIKSLRESIQKYIDMTTNEKELLSKNSYNFVVKNYNYEDKAKQYINILIDEYNKFYKSKRVRLENIA